MDAYRWDFEDDAHSALAALVLQAQISESGELPRPNSWTTTRTTGRKIFFLADPAETPDGCPE